ncbi:hypothetical protein BKA62DRAFT_765858 [Auriculariales sp. MPI-PUGE-AT-0066]|nr:hypothetical protein BKA62DRAFT_765858 [Auriculariales sp. MPI-PUGE-AT-0066]
MNSRPSPPASRSTTRIPFNSPTKLSPNSDTEVSPHGSSPRRRVTPAPPANIIHVKESKLYKEIADLEKRASEIAQRKQDAQAGADKAIAELAKVVKSKANVQTSSRSRSNLRSAANLVVCVPISRLESSRDTAVAKAKAAEDQLARTHKQIIALRKRLPKHPPAMPRVPNEILQQVFEELHASGTRQRGPFGSAKLPFFLGTICGRWRSIVRATPTLWTHVYLPKCFTSSDGDRFFVSFLQQQLDMCRPADRGVTLLVPIERGEYNWKRHDLSGPLLNFVQGLLLRVSIVILEEEDIWSHRMSMSDRTIRSGVLGLLRQSDMPLFKTVLFRNDSSATFWRRASPNISLHDYFRPDVLSRASTLRIQGCLPCDASTTTNTYFQLTHLTIVARGISVTTLDLLRLFESAPKLQYLDLACLGIFNYHDDHTVLRHELLHRFNLTITHPSHLALGAFTFVFPSLRTFGLHLSVGMKNTIEGQKQQAFLRIATTRILTAVCHHAPLLCHVHVSGSDVGADIVGDALNVYPQVETMLFVNSRILIEFWIALLGDNGQMSRTWQFTGETTFESNAPGPTLQKLLMFDKIDDLVSYKRRHRLNEDTVHRMPRELLGFFIHEHDPKTFNLSSILSISMFAEDVKFVLTPHTPY